MYFISHFPDVDTDAFVHHSIARQIILSPYDLSINWVWLPLFHYLSASAILLGANMDTIRFFNIIIYAFTPVILFFFIYSQKNENYLFIAFASSILCALFPVGILMGTTAQPEPLFTLLLLSFIIFASKEKYVLSSIFLTLLCLLRYEAWAVLIVVLIIYIIDIKKYKKIINSNILNLILPTTAIFIWAILREPFDGKLFGFLFQTQQFANDALRESNSFQGGIFKIILDLIHYPVIVPALFAGLNLIFIPFGISKCTKQNKWFVYSGLSILIFITLSWMFKSNLGLNRHFVSLIPLYSVLTTYGIGEVSGFLKRKSEKFKFFEKIKFKYSLFSIVILSCLIYLVMWLYIWNRDFRTGYPDKKSASEFLQNIPDGNTIFCNDAVVEILSKIDYKRFDRTWMENNPDAPEMIINAARIEGHVYVVISNDKWININNIGEIIFISPANKEANTKIYILKIKDQY